MGVGRDSGSHGDLRHRVRVTPPSPPDVRNIWKSDTGQVSQSCRTHLSVADGDTGLRLVLSENLQPGVCGQAPDTQKQRLLQGTSVKVTPPQDEVCGEGQALREAAQSGWAKGGQDAEL